MSKTNKIIELKKLLDSDLISQSDFDKLKKQIFDETDDTEIHLSQIKSSEVIQEIQNRKNIVNKKRCPQCGSDNEKELSFCSICNIDFSIFEDKTVPNEEIDNENNNNSKYIIIGLVGLALLISVFFYFYDNHVFNNNAEAAEAAIDSTRTAPEEVSTLSTQESNTDIDTTTNYQNHSESTEYSSTNDNLNSDNDISTNYSQENESNNDNIIFNSSEIEVKPDFPGGIEKFYRYIGKNFQVPDEKGLNGKVFVSFVIEKDGSLTDIKVIRDIGFGTGQEAVRVLESCPRWIPAEQNGKKVRVLYSLPINIQSAE
jgi:hypothetical protein